MTSGAPLLELAAVSKTFPTATVPRRVLEDVDLTVRAGDKVSLVGASGSGKTTLLSIIAGLVRPDAGVICLEDVDIVGLDDVALAALRAQRVGIVLQSGNLIPFLTARENVELATGFAPRARRRNAPELLARLGVAHRSEHLPRHLSGGEAQRVSIAVALANEPALLLADEIVGQLDSETANNVVDSLFSTDMAVVFVTHSDELARRADRRFELKNRTVVRR